MQVNDCTNIVKRLSSVNYKGYSINTQGIETNMNLPFIVTQAGSVL